MTRKISPGGELHVLFLNLRNSADPNKPAYEAFAQLLKVKEDDPRVIVVVGEAARRLLLLGNTISEDRSMSKQVRSKYTASIERLRVALSFPQLNRPWKDYSANVLRDADLDALLFLDDVLLRSDAFCGLAEADIQQLKSELTEIISRWAELDIEIALKSYVLARLHDLEFTIVNYEAFGTEYFRDKVVVATAAMNSCQATASDAAHDVAETFFKWVNRVHSLVTLVPMLPGAADAIGRLISRVQ